jgi:hypothetical protein
MAVTATSLLKETFVVYRKNFAKLLLISLIPTVVTVVLYLLFLPSAAQLFELKKLLLSTAESASALSNNFTPQQRQISITISLALLTGKTLLLSSLLPFLQQLLTRSADKTGQWFQLCPRLFIRLLLQSGYILFIVQLSAMIFLIPGIMMLILLAMAPVLLIQPDGGIFKSMTQSIRFSWKHFRLVAPVVLLLSLLHLALLPLQIFPLLNGSHVLVLIGVLLINLTESFLITYLFQLLQNTSSNK